MKNKEFTSVENLGRTDSEPRSIFVRRRRLLSEDELSAMASAPRFQSKMRSAQA